jgi:hypothetical protein
MRLLASCARKIVSTRQEQHAPPRVYRPVPRLRASARLPKRLAIIHRLCPDVVPLRDLTVDQATADYPAICFDRRKMEADRKAKANEEATLRGSIRATSVTAGPATTPNLQ